MTRRGSSGRRRYTPRVTALVGCCAIVLATIWARPAQAASGISGAGSTFAAVAIKEWVRDVNAQGLKIDYQASGSTAGRSLFVGSNVDFASSDIGFESDELPVSRPYTYLPLVAGGTAIMYNLTDQAGRRITTLRLSGPTLARIFTGEIIRWRDPAVLADNPDLAPRIPDIEMKHVVRGEGSGTTAVFTGYLNSVAPDVWSAFDARWGLGGQGFTSTYPPVDVFNRISGSDGVATFISNANNSGAIGYAEAAYAVNAGLPMAYVSNAKGFWTQPTARNVAVALLGASQNSDGTQNLNGVWRSDREDAYAISSYNYMIAPTTGFDTGKGETLVKFIVYSVTEGQRKAAGLGYSPLPPNLVDAALTAATNIDAPADVKQAALAELGKWGQFYLDLDVETPIPPGGPANQPAGPVDDGGSGAGSIVDASGSGPVVQGPGGTSATVADAAATVSPEQELAAGLTTNLAIGADGKVVLDSAAAGALDAKDMYTRTLLLIGLLTVAALFAPPMLGRLRARRTAP